MTPQAQGYERCWFCNTLRPADQLTLITIHLPDGTLVTTHLPDGTPAQEQRSCADLRVCEKMREVRP